jgi:DNA repair exonuclease SbcCD ATPase subunit
MEIKDIRKVSQKIRELWESIESIAAEIGLLRELENVEILLKFAASILEDKERILDSKFSIRFHEEEKEVSIEALFNGIHLHTIFLEPNEPISKIKEEFNDSRIALKAALSLMAEALKEASYPFISYVNKNF